MDNRIIVIGRDELPQSLSLGRDEHLAMTFVVLPGVSCDLSLTVSLDAPGASLDLAGLFLCLGSEKVSINVNVRHNSSNCTSRQLFKGLAAGSARAAFDGLIYVAPGAGKTKAAQECHSLLLSADAVVEARPQLEIYADDVECSHGATTGYLNPQERFYMQSRGIPEAEARTLQMISFLSEVAQRLPEELKQQVYDSLA